MIKKFKLWLDESGDFDDKTGEKTKNKYNPSLVGGLLCDVNEFGDKIIEKIIPENEYHATEANDGKRNIEIMKGIDAEGGQFIVFENTERVNIVDSDITYLNICVDGIVKLIKELNAKWGTFEIEIIKARRIFAEEKKKNDVINCIPFKDYERRLREKLDLYLLENEIDESMVKYNLKIDSARKLKKLMLSDVICNTYLTRTASRKYKGYENDLKILLNKYKVYSAIKTSKVDEVLSCINRNDYAEAIMKYPLCCDDEVNNVEEIISKNLCLLNSELVNNILNNVNVELDTLVNKKRKFKKPELIMKRINDNLISKLEGLNINDFIVGLKMNLLSMYTHKGDIDNSEKYINEIKEILSEHNINNNLNFIFRLKNKDAVNYNNAFQFQQALKLLDNNIILLEQKKETEKGLMELIMDKNIDEDITNEELGKSIGTRLQTRIFLSRFDKNQLELARKDSEYALREFKDSSNVNRQLQYRAIIETESGNYNVAIEYLGKSIISDGEITLKNIASAIANPINFNIFNLMHYCRIMGEAALTKSSYAKEMYDAFNENLSGLEIFKSDINENSMTNHPLEIVYWKIATYYAMNNSYKAAMEYYNKAIKVLSFNNDDTRKVIELAILCEQGYFIENNEKTSKGDLKGILNTIDKKIDSIINNSNSIGIKEFVKDNFTEYKSDLLKASRTVGY